MEILRTHETLIMCPYNRAHHIRKYRMQGHLVKCRRNHPDTEKVTCDFNATHEIPQPELEYHHEYCPDRKFVELAVFQEHDTSSSSRILTPPVNLVNFPVEDWDDGLEQSYDPERYCVKNEILRNVNVQSAAKRRNFRLMERHRFNQLKISQETKKAKDEETAAREKDEYICEMMKKLSHGPVRGIIPKISRDKDLPNDIAEKDLKLTDKKNN